ncbi:hypothetical protein MIMGU_mgv1a006299mg [Erythranthe guttata]|uniref:Uncharacterized protein n=2 Tax=Erythranthe guttata TaxID=4155 RepID=A0A022R5M9_ERYGU|nr:hypothetical protein MIMGU_mgv1a006299mg [Erythranthe guttata]
MVQITVTPPLPTTAASSRLHHRRRLTPPHLAAPTINLFSLQPMTLLELITKASSSIQTLPTDDESNYPIVLNPDPIFLKLKPESDDPNPVKKLTGWEISQTDQELIKLGQKFSQTLSRKLKNPKTFGKVEFLQMFTAYLENVGNKIGVSISFDRTEKGYPCKLVDLLGILMSGDVKPSIQEACVALEVWDVLETMIINKFVAHSLTSNLVSNLIEKRMSDLIVLCVKHLPDLQAYDLMCVLKYFLATPIEGYKTLVAVREYWTSQAMLAIEKAIESKGVGVSSKEKRFAKEAAVLVMAAHDGFSVSELCLHCFFASPNVDEVVLSACVGKLSGEEMKGLIEYLGKWLRKYERFPQIVPCPKASLPPLVLKVCDWIPSFDCVVKCLGVVLDVHFSSLVLNSEFRELTELQGVAASLANEARLCGSLVNLTERFRVEHKANDRESLANFAI